MSRDVTKTTDVRYFPVFEYRITFCFFLGNMHTVILHHIPRISFERPSMMLLELVEYLHRVEG